MRRIHLSKGVLAWLVAVGLTIGFIAAPVAAAPADAVSSDDPVEVSVDDAVSGVVDTEDVEGTEVPSVDEDIVPGTPTEVTNTGTVDTVPDAQGVPDTGTTPEIPDTGAGDTLPATPGGLEPEDFPVGDDRAQVNVCGPTDPSTEDLPLETLPGVNDLPQVTGVPTKVLTYDAILGILFSSPSPCDVIHPNEPQVDPTDPPENPDYTFEVARLSQYRGGAVYLFYWGGTLNGTSGEPDVSGTSGLLANPEDVDVDQVFVVNDGRNEYGSEFHFRNLDSQPDSFAGQSTLIIVDRPAGVEYRCNGLTSYQPDTDTDAIVSNPTGPCQSTLVGAPNVPPSQLIRGGMRLVETVGNGESPVQTEDSQLPASPDGVPVNTDQMLSL